MVVGNINVILKRSALQERQNPGHIVHRHVDIKAVVLFMTERSRIMVGEISSRTNRSYTTGCHTAVNTSSDSCTRSLGSVQGSFIYEEMIVTGSGSSHGFAA